MDWKATSTRGWLSESWLQGARPEAALQELFAARPQDPLRSVPLRETFGWPEGTPRAIVKRSRGDLFRDSAYDFLRHGRRSPGQREFDNLQALHDQGFPVPRPLGWGREGPRSLVLMERIDHEHTLRQVLEADPRGDHRTLLEALAVLVARLHRRGWYHRDLYLEHVVVDRDGRLWLLDLGRARCQAHPRSRWLAKDLGALLHSVPDDLPRATLLRFLVRYLDLRGIEARGARRQWARAAQARRTRIAAHAPRHVSPPPP